MTTEPEESDGTLAVASGQPRRVHWLELFFDLAMVAYIGQIAATMHGDPGWADALAFFALMAAAWWAWVNATVTMNLFGVRDSPMIWIAVTIAMIAIGVMAAAVPDAFSARAGAFAIGNAVIRLVWAIPWIAKRRTTGVPLWRPILYCVVPAALWTASAVVPPPTRFAFWAVAIAIEVMLLGFLGARTGWLRARLDIDHLVERVGLLVVIVFGESVLSIIDDLSEHWAPAPGLTAILGFAAVSMLAWIFFGYAASSAERGWRRLHLRGSIAGLRDTVMYLPFLLVAGIVLFAAGIGTAVADAEGRLEPGAAVGLAAGVSLFFVASVAESLRYAAPWRDLLMTGPAGMLLPWTAVAVASVAAAVTVVAWLTAVIAVLVGLSEANARRIRRRTPETVAGRGAHP